MPKTTSKNQTNLRTRAHSRGARTVDVEAKTFDIIISTETPVRTWIPNPENLAETIEVDEILLASGLDYSRTENMPLIDCHDTFSGIKSILGMVENVREVGSEIHGTAVLNTDNAGLINDIERGHYNQISAGYGVNSYEVEYRDGDVPLAYATSWTLYEASLVAVGADPNASVRSGSRTIPTPKISFRNKPKKTTAAKKNTRNSKRMEKRTMDENEIVELIEAAEAAAEIVEEAFAAVEAAIEEATDELPDEILERARKLRSADTEEEEQRGKRNDDEKKEEDEIRSIRSIAKSYGLTKAVDDLIALGTRSKDLKASIRSAIMSKAMSGGSGARSDIEPKPVRKEAKLTSAREIYAALNKRG